MQASNIIEIQDYSFGPRGTANRFEVLSYSGTVQRNTTFATRVFQAARDAQLDGDVVTQEATPEVDLGNFMVNVTLEQWNQWGADDTEFFRLLATLAGFTPVEIV